MASFDWNGAAIFLGAIGAFIVLVGNFAMSVATFISQRAEHSKNLERDVLTAGRDQKLDTISVNVNGLNKKVADVSRAAGTAEGINIGVAQERAAQAEELPPSTTSEASK